MGNTWICWNFPGPSKFPNWTPSLKQYLPDSFDLKIIHHKAKKSKNGDENNKEKLGTFLIFTYTSQHYKYVLSIILENPMIWKI
jgi:hypothetical protein